MKKIGVAVSIYGNSNKQIYACLSSIEKQMWNIKVVVCLVGWNANQYLTMNRFSKFSFKTFDHSLGCAGDWNRAVSYLDDCDYITFVHADDFIDCDHIRQLANYILDYDICFASLRYNEPYWKRMVYAVKNRDISLLWKKRVSITNPNVTTEGLLERNTLPCFALIKRKVWDEIGGYTKWCDWTFWIEASKRNYSMTACKQATYNYRVHPYTKEYIEQRANEVRGQYGY